MRDHGNVLVVDPDPDVIGMFEDVLMSGKSVEGFTDFVAARIRLLDRVPDLLVTNLRLGSYNGLHLVYLAATSGSPTRCIVYSDHHDPLLMKDVQSAGAEYESKERVRDILASYGSDKLTDFEEPRPIASDHRLDRYTTSHG